MEIEVVCYGVLKDHLPHQREGNRAALEASEDASVEQVARALGIHAQQVFAVLVNGERAGLTHQLRDGDRVTLMPPFSGGS